MDNITLHFYKYNQGRIYICVQLCTKSTYWLCYFVAIYVHQYLLLLLTNQKHMQHTHTHTHMYIYTHTYVCVCAHACTHTYSRSANKNRRNWCTVYILLFNQDIINITFYLTCDGAVKVHHCKKDDWIKNEKHKFIYVWLVIKCMNYWSNTNIFVYVA